MRKVLRAEKACNAVIAGKYHDQLQVDWYQGGARTSTNLNADEVLANVGLKLIGTRREGARLWHWTSGSFQPLAIPNSFRLGFNSSSEDLITAENHLFLVPGGGLELLGAH